MKTIIELPSLRDLSKKNLPPLVWLICGLLTEGVFVLCGKPKTKKSWLVLNIAISIALGKPILSNAEVHSGRVLYLSLEDPERRIKERSQQILSSLDQIAPSNLHYRTDFPSMDDGGEEILNIILDTVKEFKLIIIDMLHNFIHFQEQNSYQEAYSKFGLISKLAKQYHTCILFVHHSKKDSSSYDAIDDILGSTGIAGSVDGIFVLRPHTEGTVLHTSGKDIEQHELLMQFDSEAGIWKIIGDAENLLSSEIEKSIMDFLKTSANAKTPKGIADETGLNHNSVKTAVVSLERRGLLKKLLGGKYEISAT